MHSCALIDAGVTRPSQRWRQPEVNSLSPLESQVESPHAGYASAHNLTPRLIVGMRDIDESSSIREHYFGTSQIKLIPTVHIRCRYLPTQTDRRGWDWTQAAAVDDEPISGDTRSSTGVRVARKRGSVEIGAAREATVNRHVKASRGCHGEDIDAIGTRCGL
jgi:hypothetical protein